jgi:TetR/AcrR family tetracycline transcriptional repressor
VRKKKAAAKPVGRLDRDQVVRAALKLLDDEGRDGVSTRRLAEKLGISGPSLYWHFKNKRELFDHMAEAMLADALPAGDALMSDVSWQEWLVQSARAIRRAMLSHRDGASVIAGARPTGEHPSLDLPAMVERLVQDGFDERDARYVLRALTRYVLGAAVTEQSALEREGVKLSETSFEFGLGALVAGFEAMLGAKPKKKRAK